MSRREKSNLAGQPHKLDYRRWKSGRTSHSVQETRAARAKKCGARRRIELPERVSWVTVLTCSERYFVGGCENNKSGWGWTRACCGVWFGAWSVKDALWNFLSRLWAQVTKTSACDSGDLKAAARGPERKPLFRAISQEANRTKVTSSLQGDSVDWPWLRAERKYLGTLATANNTPGDVEPGTWNPASAVGEYAKARPWTAWSARDGRCLRPVGVGARRAVAC